MEELEAKDYLAAWSDIVSLLLIAFAIAVAGIDPRLRVWGRGLLRNLLIIFAVSLNVIFSIVRLVAEGILVATGPREFLVVSVIYCARWIWLFCGISHSRSGKAFKVAKQLRQLQTIRLGRSTREPDSNSTNEGGGFVDALYDFLSQAITATDKSDRYADFSQDWTVPIPKNLDLRRGEKELVMRRGERTVNGTVYWRGVEEYVDVFPRNASDATYFVGLVQRELHSNHLDEIGTCDFKKRLNVEAPDGLYKKIYDLVMSCDAQNSELPVDYSPFLNDFKGIPVTAQARRVGADSDEVLGAVARRVAADACVCVFFNGVMRTGQHVECINKCIRNAAKSYLGLDTADGDPTV